MLLLSHFGRVGVPRWTQKSSEEGVSHERGSIGFFTVRRCGPFFVLFWASKKEPRGRPQRGKINFGSIKFGIISMFRMILFKYVLNPVGATI